MNIFGAEEEEVFAAEDSEEEDEAKLVIGKGNQFSATTANAMGTSRQIAGRWKSKQTMQKRHEKKMRRSSSYLWPDQKR